MEQRGRAGVKQKEQKTKMQFKEKKETVNLDTHGRQTDKLGYLDELTQFKRM